MAPLESSENVCLPARTPTVGSPNRFASAGERKDGLRPLDVTVTEPSACAVNFADAFSVMAFPVLRFVYECLNEPVLSMPLSPRRARRRIRHVTAVIVRAAQSSCRRWIRCTACWVARAVPRTARGAGHLRAGRWARDRAWRSRRDRGRGAPGSADDALNAGG